MTAETKISLPEFSPRKDAALDLAVLARHSVREFAPGSLTLDQAARLMFAAQGVTRKGFYRTVPSAGALYPLEIHLAAGRVDGLEPGVYKYRPREHDMVMTAEGDQRRGIAEAALHQGWIAAAQAVIVICAVYSRVTGKYGQRGIMYTHQEVGCAAQNILLAAASLDLGGTFVGAFSDKVQDLLNAEPDEQPLAVLPVGVPKE